jgi:hypothetical protein
MLLKMAFIDKPQIKPSPVGQFLKFFYMRPWPPDRLGRLTIGVSFFENLIDGTASDTGGRPSRCGSGLSDDDLGACRPREFVGNLSFPPKTGQEVKVH